MHTNEVNGQEGKMASKFDNQMCGKRKDNKRSQLDGWLVV